MAEVAGTSEFRFWIMSWGSKAVALEQESLIKETLAEAELIASGYGASHVAEQTPDYCHGRRRPFPRG